MHRPLPHACQDEVHNAFGRTVDGIGGMRLQECALALLPVMLTRRCYAQRSAAAATPALALPFIEAGDLTWLRIHFFRRRSRAHTLIVITSHMMPTERMIARPRDHAKEKSTSSKSSRIVCARTPMASASDPDRP